MFKHLFCFAYGSLLPLKVITRNFIYSLCFRIIRFALVAFKLELRVTNGLFFLPNDFLPSLSTVGHFELSRKHRYRGRHFVLWNVIHIFIRSCKTIFYKKIIKIRSHVNVKSISVLIILWSSPIKAIHIAYT